MPLQSLGHEVLTRRKRQKAIAAFYNANPTKFQQGVPPSQMDGLTYLDRRLGNTTERSISAGGLVVEDLGCACDASGGGGGGTVTNIIATVDCNANTIDFDGSLTGNYPAGTYTLTVQGADAQCAITLTTGFNYKLRVTSTVAGVTSTSFTVDTSFTLFGTFVDCIVPNNPSGNSLVCDVIGGSLISLVWMLANNTTSILYFQDTTNTFDMYILPGLYYVYDTTSSGTITYNTTCPASLA